MNITLLKLGGSLITDKSQPYTARPVIIKRLITEIKEALAEHPDLHIILGNGAGSFAHQSASRFKIKEGFTDASGAFGAAKVHFDASRLHSIVVQECINQQLPIYSFQPSANMVSKNRELADRFFQPIEIALDHKLIPFVYGDIILDFEKGATIFSTDTIFVHLARYFIKNFCKIRIINAGNYDGVLDIKGKIIPNITPDSLHQIESSLTASTHTDVTGGMRMKVVEFVRLAEEGVESSIMNGSIEGTIKRALAGESVGTKIVSK